MKRNLFFQLLGRLRVGRKLLLIYLLDLSAVLFISGILIHEKYLAINFSNKEIVGNAYVSTARAALTDIALAGAGWAIAPSRIDLLKLDLADAERQYGEDMQSAKLNEQLRASLDQLAASPLPSPAGVDAALQSSRALITRVGNQSNLILDPDLDSYYSMSLSILRYPALLDAYNDIGRLVHDEGHEIRNHDELRTRYLVLEGQLDAVLQGLRTDLSEAGAANARTGQAITPTIQAMLTGVEAYRGALHRIIDNEKRSDPAVLAVVDARQRDLISSTHAAWLATGDELDRLIRARVHGLFMRMWLHLGTALFLLTVILCMVYLVAQQISRPLRRLAGIMDMVRHTGDHSLRASWDSQDEIGQLVRGFNDMLQQLDREREAQKEMAAKARAAAAQHAMVEATPVPMMVTAIPGHEVLHANQSARSWLDGRTGDPWAHGLDSTVRARFFQMLSDHDAVDEFEVKWQSGAEAGTWAMLSARRLDFQGLDAVLTAFTPINRIKTMERRLELWAKVFEASSESILILDAERRLVSANTSFYRATGYNAADLTDKTPDALLFDVHGAPLGRHVSAQVDRIGTWNGEALIRRRQGGDYPAWLMINAVRDKSTLITNYICTIIDITDRKQSEARIRFLAEHDVLTELPNRALFTKRLGNILEHGHHNGNHCAVLFIDLDRFKDINDSLGHHIGDGLLRSISQRLLQALRGRDMVSRLGGDEFTIVLDDVGDKSDVERIINERLIPLVRQPHEIDGITLQVACSVGVACFPEDGRDIETLMQNADAAMYQAKAAGRNLVTFFSAEMAERSRERLSLETGLRQAIDQQELTLVYQPCVDANTGALTSIEALLRWNNPQLGEVPPAQFIPLAEETRLIVPIGSWVIDEACRQVAVWRAQGLPNLRVSLNISTLQLREPELLGTLSTSLETHGILPGQLEIEITETALMDNTENYLAVIKGIRALGVRMSLDDFGTGYSSLSYLNRIPLDRLKIDRSFVQDMLDASSDLAVIKAIIELGHELGLRVVAEGVENEAEVLALRGIGCDELQGFLYSVPMLPGALPAWLQERQFASA